MMTRNVPPIWRRGPRMCGITYWRSAAGCRSCFTCTVRASCGASRYRRVARSQRRAIREYAVGLSHRLRDFPGSLRADRRSARSRALLTFLILAWSLVTGLTALAGYVPASAGGPYVFLLAARFLFGVFQAGFFPVWSRVIADWIPITERGSAQGFVWMFSRLGGAVSPFLFLGLLDLCGTWTTPFWLEAGLGMLVAVPFWIWFRNRPEQMPQVNAAERALITAGRPDAAPLRGPIPWLALLTSLNVWGLCLMYGFVGSSGNFITNLLPIYLKVNRQLSPAATTWLAGLPLAAGIVSCLTGGVLSDWISRRWQSPKWGRRFSGIVGLTLAGLAILAVPWVHSVWILATLLSVSFFRQRPDDRAGLGRVRRRGRTVRGHDQRGDEHGWPVFRSGRHALRRCHAARRTYAIAVPAVRLRLRLGGALLAGR